MNAGYVRLSKDDDKRNYVSIENQKLIINQFATENNMVIDRWYEDDGVSGYKLDRPGFNQLMEDLDKDVDRVFVKDFSRLGRHNAKVLLLLDDFQERGKQLIVIDDNYDSMQADDDTIGIKTWYNERYVKDTSKKIKRALGARQKEGTLMTQPPFGYKRNEKDKSKIEIVPKEAEYVKMVYDLYMKGSGYRMIANHLTEKKVPTPSMVRHERELEEGKVTKRLIATEWSDSMVKDMLGNDFYIGTLRLHKRVRSTVHGRDKRVPKNEQYVFENNHSAIIDKASFDLIQNMKEKRVKNNYRGSRGQWIGSEIPNPFGSCLFCKDCGSRLTPIKRTTSSGERKYYICTTYNTKGKRYCSKAHLIEEGDLMEDIITYIKLCRNALSEVIATYDMKDFDSEKRTVEEKRSEIQSDISEYKKQLKVLFAQKVRDLSNAHGNEDIVNETYDALQQDILSQIHGSELQLKEFECNSLENKDEKEKLQNALQVVDKIIEKSVLDRKDIEILIERIEVDEGGFPEIELKYSLSEPIWHSLTQEMNHRENQIIYQTMRLTYEEERGYTSAKYLSKALTDLGYPESKKSVLPYIGLMMNMGIVETSDNSLKPYMIVKTKEEIEKLMQNFQQGIPSENDNGEHVTKIYMDRVSTGGMPQMVFEYILKKNGLDPVTDMRINQSIDFGSTAAAFSGGQGDFTVEFEPSATALEKEGDGYVVASLGVDSGYVPYTSYSAKTSYLEKNPQVIQKFTNALQKGVLYVNSHTPEEIAKVIQPQFKENDLDTITTIVRRYQEQNTWKENLIFEKDSFELLQDILEEAGELENRAEYDKLVTTEFAKKAIDEK